MAVRQDAKTGCEYASLLRVWQHERCTAYALHASPQYHTNHTSNELAMTVTPEDLSLADLNQRCAERIKGLQEILRERRLAGALLFQSRDILYYTGSAQPAYFVVLPDYHRLFVRRGYEFARRECALEAQRVIREGSIAAVCQQMFPGAGAGEKVGSELDLMTLSQARGINR